MKLMTGNKWDLGCIITGAITSAFLDELMVKVFMTVISMVVGTTVAFYWRRHLHFKTREKLRKKKQDDNN